MFVSSCRLLLLAAVLAVPLSGQAAIHTFQASLDGAQEVPPVATPAVGAALLILDDATNIFNLIMGGGGLTSTIVAAHLHKAPVGVSGGIVRDLGVPGTFPQNTFGATFINQALDSQLTLADLVSGLIYVNVHTVNFPNGEIRGQFRELLPIPEPGTLALVGVGLLMFAGSALRRRSSS